MQDGARYKLTLQPADGNIAQADVRWRGGSIDGFNGSTGFVGYLKLEDNQCSGHLRQVFGTEDENNPIRVGDVYEFKSVMPDGDGATFNLFSSENGMTGIARFEPIEEQGQA